MYVFHVTKQLEDRWQRDHFPHSLMAKSAVKSPSARIFCKILLTILNDIILATFFAFIDSHTETKNKPVEDV